MFSGKIRRFQRGKRGVYSLNKNKIALVIDREHASVWRGKNCYYDFSGTFIAQSYMILVWWNRLHYYYFHFIISGVHYRNYVVESEPNRLLD